MSVNTIPVKSVAVRGLMADLKHFAFEQNPAMADGSQSGVEITKNFFHRDLVPDPIYRSGGVEMAMTSVWFSAFRIGTGKGAYGYAMSHAIERSLPSFPDHLRPALSPKQLRKHDNFTNVMHNALHERLAVDVGISDDMLEEVDYSQTYRLLYMGKNVLRIQSDDITAPEGTFVRVPPPESDYHDQPIIWAQDPIEREKIDPVDAVEMNLHFWDTVTPLSDSMESDGFRAAAATARTIMRILRTGKVE